MKYSILFRISTSPGIIVHEFAHHVTADVLNVHVSEAKYFKLFGPAGYVVTHPRHWHQVFFTAMAPIVVNIAIAITALDYSLSILSIPGIWGIATGVFSYWLAFSCLVHSIPSYQDVKIIREETYAKWFRWPLLVLAEPIYWSRRATEKVGVYKITFPIAFLTISWFSILHGATPSALSECLFRGAWGCWESSPLTFRWIENISRSLSQLILL